MTVDKIPIEFVRAKRPSLNEYLLSSTSLPVFPILLLRFKHEPKLFTYEADITVDSKIYDLLKKAYGTDELLIYQNSTDGSVGLWSFDMLLGMKILTRLQILSEQKDWVIKGRSALASLLNNQKVDSKVKNAKALEAARSLLDAIGILDAVEKNTSLARIIKIAIGNKQMDAETIIYRIAMAIYHSKTITDQAVIEQLEDPSTLYLNLSQTNYFSSHGDMFSDLDIVEITAKNLVIKVMTVFAVAAYVYYKEAST